MVQNIVIEFTSDTSGLAPGVEQLEKLGVIDKGLADSFNNTNKAIKEQQTALAGTTSAVKTFSDNLGNVGKATAGAFGTKVIDNFTKQGTDGAKSIAKMIDSIEASMKKVQQAAANSINPELAEQYAKSLSDSRAQLDQLYAALDEIQSQGDVFDEFKQGAEGAGNKSEELANSQESLKKKLKELKAEAALTKFSLEDMTEAGLQNSQEFKDLDEKYQKLIQDAGRLSDTIGDVSAEISTAGSDTSGLDKTLRLANAGVGAFTAYQGAAALFGGESEELQKTLVKLNAAMSILQGLQAIQEELSKQDSLATKGLTVVKATYATVVGTSTGALKLFRIALAATGIGLIVIAIAALVENFDKVKSAILNIFPSLKGFGDGFDKLKATVAGFFDAAFSALKTYAIIYKDIITLNWGAIAEDYKNGGKEIASSFKEGFEKKMKEINLEDSIKKRTKDISKLDLQISTTETSTGRTDYASKFQKYEEAAKLASEKAAQYLLKNNITEKELDEKGNEDKFTAYQEFLKEKQDATAGYIETMRSFNKQELTDASSIANAKVLLAVNGSKNELNAKYAQAKAEYNLALSEAGLSEAKKAEIKAQYRDKIEALNKDSEDRGHKNTIASYEAMILKQERLGQQSTESYLSNKLKLINADYDYQIAQDIKLNGSKSESAKKLEEQKLDAIKKASDDYKTLQLNNLEYLNNAALAKEDLTVQKELNLKLNAAKIQHDKELIAAGENADKKVEIEANYIKKIGDLNKEYTYKEMKDTLDIRIAAINNQIAPLEVAAEAATSQKLLKLKQGLVDQQVLLDKAGIEKQVKDRTISEELGTSLIKGINEKANADKIKMARDTSNAILDADIKLKDSQINIEIEKNNEIVRSAKSSLKEKIQAEKEVNKLQGDLLTNEKKQATERYLNGTDSYAVYQAKLNDITVKRLANEEQAELKAAAKKKEIQAALYQAALNIAQQTSDAIFEADAANRQAASAAIFEDLENRKAKELSAKNLTDQQKADIEAKYKAKENQQRLKDAKAEKDAKVAQALMNAALAVTAVFAVPDFTFGVLTAIRLAVIAASSAISIAKIKSTPLPGLYRGTKSATEGIYRLGELGRELMYSNDTGFQLFGQRGEEVGFVPQGARVFNAKETSDLFAAGFPSMQMPSFDMPVMSPLPSWAEAQLSGAHQVKQPQIDYSRIGQEFAKHVGKISDLPGVDLRIDENGIVVIAKKGHDRIKINNSRYSNK